MNKVDQVDDEELLELVEMEIIRELSVHSTLPRRTTFRASRLGFACDNAQQPEIGELDPCADGNVDKLIHACARRGTKRS